MIFKLRVLTIFQNKLFKIFKIRFSQQKFSYTFHSRTNFLEFPKYDFRNEISPTKFLQCISCIPKKVCWWCSSRVQLVIMGCRKQQPNNRHLREVDSVHKEHYTTLFLEPNKNFKVS